METDKEALQIIQGAKLAGKEAPERMDMKRAELFVSQKLANGKPSDAKKASRNSKVWITVALSVAAGLALLLWFSLSSDPGNGEPGVLLERQSIHATSADADSLQQKKDSLEIPILEIVK